MLIEVTLRDIRDGVPEWSCRCPVALAIARATGCWPVIVRVDEVEWVDADGKRHVVPLPPELAEFIDRFDRRKRVGPLTFEL